MSPAPLPGRLPRLRLLARGVLLWERVWPALWPPLAVLGVFLLAALAGIPALLPPALHLALLAGFAAALGVTLWRGFHRFVLPDAMAADRRIERDSGLRHRPLSTLSDRPAGQDPAALALWEAHRRRAAAQLAATRIAPPRPGLAARDPRALRAGLGLAVLAALVMAGDSTGERLRRAFEPGFAAAALPPSMRIEAWATPPAYTGAAPIFLSPEGGAVALPQGSRLQVSLSGGGGGDAPSLALDAETVPMRALDRASFAGEVVLQHGGQLRLARDGQPIAAWTVTVQADTPPRVSFAEPPARAQRGLATRLPWRAEDDWGVAGLAAEFRLAARPDAEPHRLDIPLPGANPRHAQGAAQPDLSAHPWAGLDVTIRLTARDGAGQEGRSESVTLTLPERSFNHPVAQALIALRKALSVDPTAREPAWRALDRITAAPEAFENDAGTFLALRAARHRLQRDRRPAAIDEVQAILWEVAIALEEGRADRTARALAAAREALREALDTAQRDDNPTPEQRAELDRRIQELREAVRRHLEALAERLQQQNGEQMPFDPSNRLMDRRELDRRTERMRDAAREGRTEDAQRELAELEEMLRALEEGRVANPAQRQRQERQQRGRQQMGAVQDMVRRQAEMLDHGQQRGDAADRRRAAERRQQQPFPSYRWPETPPQPPSQEQGQAQGQAQAPDAAADARRQRALRRALGELMQQFGDLTGEVPESLGRADQAMREAGENLGEGRDARDAQGRAMRALMEGGREMAQQMQRRGMGQQDGEDDGDGQQAGDQQPGGGTGENGQQQGEGRDPLGRRQRDTAGAIDNGADTRVPEEAEVLRTRRLQEELRRRGAERERPPAELDYIDRLLRQF